MRQPNKCKILLLLAIILAFAFTLAAQERQVSISSEGNQAQLRDNSDFGFNIQFKVGELKLREIQTKAGLFDEVSIEGWASTNTVGEPKLPMLRQIIAVPVGADVRYTVNSQTQRQLSQTDALLKHRIIPAQESVSKNADPSQVEFIVNEGSYRKSGFANRDYIRIEEIGYMRGVRLFAIEYFPVQYDPTTNSLQIMQEYTIRVDFDHPDLVATAELLAKTGSYEFDKLYSQSIVNWRTDERTSLMRYPTKMLILCPPNYTDEMQTFVDWKKQQGFNVVVTTVGTSGTVANTTAAIKTYMTNVWSAATAQDPAPSFLLIVGDTGTTGDNVTASAATVTSPSSSHVTDNYYVRLQGTDYIPEIYCGRFSVSSATELTNVITKTMTWEKTAMPDLSYLGNVVMIAGADASYAPTYGNGQINYGTTHYFNSTFGMTSNTYLYPASETSDAAIIANANAGRGYMNYTAHGSETSWADPTFSVSDVNAMTNTNKYGVMVGNCCVTNSFAYSSPCFGESIIRKANAGGVAYIGCSNNSYWNEDYWWGIGYKTPIQAAAHPYSATTLGAYDAIFHSHGEATTDWAPTIGETNYMGNLAVTQSASSYTNYYWEIYTIMGDPSLMTYMGVPTTNAATYPSQILIGATSITVTAAPYSRVALTMGGVNYGTGIVPSGGSLTLTITPFTAVGTAKLTITAQNKITIQADVSVIPNSGPYVSVSSQVYADGNNNVAEYNETGRYNVTFQNVGSVAATSVVATLTCSTSGITITDNTETIASLAAGASTTVTNAYTFNTANNIVNGTSAAFTITMVSGANTWVHNFTQVINSPALAFGSMTISDPAPGNNNGRLDPGETVTITMPLNNTGAAASPSGSATLTSPTSGITINTGTSSFAAIAASGSASLSFSITASSSMTIGTVTSLVFNATAGSYTASKTETTTVGIILEDFSTGNFNAFPWVQGTTPWVIVSDNYHSASYGAKSGTILASGSTTLETTRILSSSGTLTFWYKVSSESGYDYLKFYIDGTVQNSWSGTVDWTQATYTLAAGTRVLKWEYMKDSSVDSGSDCAWVDDIVFPASTAPSSFYPPRTLTATPGNGYVNLAWQAPISGTPTGYKIFRNSTLLTTVTGLTYSDTAVTNETTYSYYLTAAYTGGESDPTSTVTATPTAIVPTSAIIGTGTTATGTSEGCPINVYYQSLHGQSVYLATELNAAGVVGPINITQIGFNVTGLPSLAMPSYVIRLGHTTATNVASWISTGLTQVWTTASYQPTATGWNMLTLSTPFLWNGTDNIVIDTAFGLIGSYTSTGTVQASTVTSGYRFVRSDTVNETSVYTGGSTTTNRPNVKLTLLPNAAGPMIVATPTTLTYGNVAVGASSTQQFTIQNSGDQTLSGTIQTPTGYTVAQAARSQEVDLTSSKDSRNTISFSVNSGSSKVYDLTLTPTAATAYNGNVVITSNAVNNATVNVAVTGAGYIPPTIDIDNNFLYADLQVGDSSTDSFTITNTGSQTLNYSIVLEEVTRGGNGNGGLTTAKTDRSIAGSTCTLDVSEYTPGMTQDWIVTVTNASTDTEWLEHVYLTLPAGVTLNSASNMTGGTGGALVPTPTSGTAVTIDWYGETSSGWGMIQGSETGTATINVTIAPTVAGNLTLAFQLNGDVYGAEPHILTGDIVLTQAVAPIEWFSAQPLSGSILAGQSQLITGYFSAVGMAAGTYEAILTIASNDPINPTLEVGIMMDVNDNGNHAPIINVPASCAFDKNSNLVMDMAPYVSDSDNDPLTISVDGNTNVLAQISGLVVTFSAVQNWIGTENLTITVSDGITSRSDMMTVDVNAVNMPTWTPVVYPNNSATIYGIVTIDLAACQLNDVVGAFVGTECRAVAEVTVTGGNAYVTLLVNLASAGEVVSFQVYDFSTDTIYPVTETQTLNFGQVVGNVTPLPINGQTVVVLPPPEPIVVEIPTGGSNLEWPPVPQATEYRIYRATDPYGVYELIATVSAPEYVDAYILPYAFYKVVAVSTGAKK